MDDAIRRPKPAIPLGSFQPAESPPVQCRLRPTDRIRLRMHCFASAVARVLRRLHWPADTTAGNAVRSEVRILRAMRGAIPTVMEPWPSDLVRRPMARNRSIFESGQQLPETIIRCAGTCPGTSQNFYDHAGP